MFPLKQGSARCSVHQISLLLLNVFPRIQRPLLLYDLARGERTKRVRKLNGDKKERAEFALLTVSSLVCFYALGSLEAVGRGERKTPQDVLAVHFLTNTIHG